VYFHCKLLNLQNRGGRRDFGMAGEILVCHTIKMYGRKDRFQVNVVCSNERIKIMSDVHIHATNVPILKELLQEMCLELTGNNVNVKLK
jgi:hypothetical protein